MLSEVANVCGLANVPAAMCQRAQPSNHLNQAGLSAGEWRFISSRMPSEGGVLGWTVNTSEKFAAEGSSLQLLVLAAATQPARRSPLYLMLKVSVLITSP